MTEQPNVADAAPPPSRRGDDDDRVDPRVAQTQQQVHAAVIGLLADEGLEAITHARVAERAGVGRATVYRHWADRDALLLDALRAHMPPIAAPPDTGEPLDDVRAMLRVVAQHLSSTDNLLDMLRLTHRAKREPLLTAAQRHLLPMPPQGAQLEDSPLRPMLDAAVEQGLVRDDLEPAIATAQLLGPLFALRLLELAPLTDDLVDALVDAWLQGARPG